MGVAGDIGAEVAWSYGAACDYGWQGNLTGYLWLTATGLPESIF